MDVPIGLALLASAMLGAIVTWLFIIGPPMNAIFPGIFLAGLIALYAVAAVDRPPSPKPALANARLLRPQSLHRIHRRRPPRRQITRHQSRHASTTATPISVGTSHAFTRTAACASAMVAATARRMPAANADRGQPPASLRTSR